MIIKRYCLSDEYVFRDGLTLAKLGFIMKGIEPSSDLIPPPPFAKILALEIALVAIFA